MGNTDRKRIRIPLLLPLCLAIVLLVSCSIGGIVWIQYLRVREDVKGRLGAVEAAFKEKLAEDAEKLSAILDFLKNDETLRQAWLAKDRDALFSNAIDTFKDIRSKYKVTHLYFHQLDRICFLRVHNPSKYGDYIKRFTMDMSQKKQGPAYGIELGKFGTFTLRIVHPWKIDGELVGYIELGEEIEHITPKVSELINVDLLFLIDKTRLELVKWQEGLKFMGRTGDWNQFSQSVLIDSTIQKLSSTISKKISSHYHFEHKMFVFKGATDQRYYVVGFVPLFDVSGAEIGDIVVISDITGVASALIVSVVIGIIITAAMLILFYIYIGRVERKTTKAYQDIENEVISRRKAETELIEANEHLRLGQEQLEANGKRLEKSLEELERFNNLTVGREQRMIELKQQVNELLGELGREEQYQNMSNVMKVSSVEGNYETRMGEAL